MPSVVSGRSVRHLSTKLTHVPTHSPYSRSARRPPASRLWSTSPPTPTLILAPTPSPDPGPTPTPHQVNEHNRIMIPIIFLTETQLEPAEVKWMHGVRMRESYGIDVLRHVEHQGRITGATAHYTLASWGWLSRLLAALRHSGRAAKPLRAKLTGCGAAVRSGPRSSVLEPSSVPRCSSAPNVTWLSPHQVLEGAKPNAGWLGPEMSGEDGATFKEKLHWAIGEGGCPSRHLTIPSHHLTALLPYCPTALLPLLPYCPTALLPYCPTALLPYCPTAPTVLPSYLASPPYHLTILVSHCLTSSPSYLVPSYHIYHLTISPPHHLTSSPRRPRRGLASTTRSRSVRTTTGSCCRWTR